MSPYILKVFRLRLNIFFFSRVFWYSLYCGNPITNYVFLIRHINPSYGKMVSVKIFHF